MFSLLESALCLWIRLHPLYIQGLKRLVLWTQNLALIEGQGLWIQAIVLHWSCVNAASKNHLFGLLQINPHFFLIHKRVEGGQNYFLFLHKWVQDKFLSIFKKTKMLSRPLWLASRSECHGLPNRRWHASISTTSHKISSKYLAPMEKLYKA